ncbi:MAG: HlyC/CorC family transporter [Chloroflexi bacterium]|nr:MAG: HlyC/CorC family transporter [Chloroflexota bacterium]MBL1193768.1 HlyC/CorC family transporter [Chloroflexota bacterium]NOH11061.1 HlyC/CorC family transporter [Chloroflexota bacterium]
MNWLIILVIVVVLIAFNALYVAAEFSTVSASRPRLAQLAEGGNSTAQTLLTIVEDPHKLDAYVATCQVGITISSLVLGFFGQAQVAQLIAPFFVSFGDFSEIAALSTSVTIILILFSSLQILFGELIPKNIGIQYPERMAILTELPLRWSANIFRPLIWIFNGSGQLIMRLFGLDNISEHAHLHRPEEIVMLVEESGAGGLLDREEERLLKNILDINEVMVRQVMIPRTRMIAAPDNLPFDAIFKLVADSPFSRIPIYKDSIDNITGFVHLRDFLCHVQAEEKPNITDLMNQVPFVTETMAVKSAFSLLQRRHFHIAIVLDEFGGTSGLITLEDLIEEIFGDLQDEFDDLPPSVRLVGRDRLWLRGDTLIGDLNEYLDLNLPDDEVDTVGGLVLNAMGHVPYVTEEILVDGATFRVEKMSGRGVAEASMRITKEQAARVEELLR